MTPDGELVVGNSFNTDRGYAEAAKWHWNGASWDRQVLGALAGTFANYGNVSCYDVSADGSTIVGSNGFDWSQFTGFIWTQETGMVDVEDFLTDNGVPLPPLFDIQSLTAISDDGTVMVGFGQDMVPPWSPRSFIITKVATGIDGVSTNTGTKLNMSIHPNPARADGTRSSFSMPQSGSVSLEIYDVAGRLIRTIEASDVPAGMQGFGWDGMNSAGEPVSSSVYLCHLEAGANHATGKLTVLK